jgi:hypothetical protein
VWPLVVCNNEDQMIWEEIHIICGEIINWISNILCNKGQDEDENANDNDDEFMDSSEDVSCSFTSVDNFLKLCSEGV